MNRYILIDKHSGYIFGDTADRWWRMDEAHPVGPMDAAMSLDNALFINTDGKSYACVGKRDERAIYDVYTADDSFPAVHDGQDQSLINAVCGECVFVTSISRY